VEPKPTLNRITIYPVKSLDGISLQKALIGKGGCLVHDREYAITDADGQFITGKTNPLVHSLRSTFELDDEIIYLRHQNETSWKKFHFRKDLLAIQLFLTDFFGIPLVLQKNMNGRFMDIPDISGMTVLSTASLQSISQWFDKMNLDEARRRFRATIEIEGVPPFWEDRLFSKEDIGIEFKIGDVTLIGISPRARCVVPTRNPDSGVVTHSFPKYFAEHRAASLPQWSKLNEYGHHYHLTVNCSVPPSELGKWIHVGNEVHIVGEKKLK
jgi:uncharacterized protein